MFSVLDTIKKSSRDIYLTMSKLNFNQTKQFDNKNKCIANQNGSGDIQKPLDIISNNIIKDNLSKIPEIAGLISEEEKDYIALNPNGKYIVSYDPMDGSGNSTINLSTGSIYCVFKGNKLTDIKGSNIVAAVYTIYGATLHLVEVTDSSKYRYHYDRDSDLFVNLCELKKIKDKGDIYVANMRYSKDWPPNIQNFIDNLTNRNLRWMACFVADVHRLLVTGGIFLYPANKKYGEGKLRLLYEAYPMAFIWEKCGGYSLFDNQTSILKYPFDGRNIHQKTPVYLFSKEEYISFQNSL